VEKNTRSAAGSKFMTFKITLAILSGLLTGLSFNYPCLWFLVWFSLVPFFYAMDKASSRGGLILGIVFSLAYYAVAIFWIAKVTVLGLIVLLGYLSLYYGLFVFLYRNFLKKTLLVLSLPSLWVILEFLKERVWTGFGWANLGYSQYRNLYFIQTADLWGEKFISFIIVMVNVLIWRILLRKLKLSALGLVVFIFLGSFLYSFWRLDTLDKQDSLEVSLIQPNIPQELKWKGSGIQEILDKLSLLGKKTKENTLVILPEASWPLVVDENNISDLASFSRATGNDLLIGAVRKQGQKSYNTALLFDKTGKLNNSYQKIKLVPFGEYVPWRRFLSFISVINSIGDMEKGQEITEFSYQDKKFTVLICFEDVFPLHVAESARNSDFLINITNDAWFGGEPEASQHLGVMTFRAIENRISIIRAANTGLSGWVSFKGRITKLKNNGKDLFFSGTETFDVALNNQRSFYNKYGEVFPLFCGIILLAVKLLRKTRYKL
jgi:apolipoprotein N-acyltransferase